MILFLALGKRRTTWQTFTIVRTLAPYLLFQRNLFFGTGSHRRSLKTTTYDDVYIPVVIIVISTLFPHRTALLEYYIQGQHKTVLSRA